MDLSTGVKSKCINQVISVGPPAMLNEIKRANAKEVSMETLWKKTSFLRNSFVAQETVCCSGTFCCSGNRFLLRKSFVAQETFCCSGNLLQLLISENTCRYQDHFLLRKLHGQSINLSNSLQKFAKPMHAVSL